MMWLERRHLDKSDYGGCPSNTCLWRGHVLSADSFDSFNGESWFLNSLGVKPEHCFLVKHSMCTASFQRYRFPQSLVSFCHSGEIFEALKHRDTEWQIHTLRVPLNPLIAPSQSPEIHIKTASPAGASRSFGMAAPWITRSMDARQRPPTLPRKSPLANMARPAQPWSLFQPN